MPPTQKLGAKFVLVKDSSRNMCHGEKQHEGKASVLEHDVTSELQEQAEQGQKTLLNREMQATHKSPKSGFGAHLVHALHDQGRICVLIPFGESWLDLQHMHALFSLMWVKQSVFVSWPPTANDIQKSHNLKTPTVVAVMLCQAHGYSATTVF
jgi:hypothetical protein